MMIWRQSGNEDRRVYLELFLAFRRFVVPWVVVILPNTLYGQLMIPPIFASQKRWYALTYDFVNITEPNSDTRQVEKDHLARFGNEHPERTSLYGLESCPRGVRMPD